MKISIPNIVHTQVKTSFAYRTWLHQLRSSFRRYIVHWAPEVSRYVYGKYSAGTEWSPCRRMSAFQCGWLCDRGRLHSRWGSWWAVQEIVSSVQRSAVRCCRMSRERTRCLSHANRLPTTSIMLMLILSFDQDQHQNYEVQAKTMIETRDIKTKNKTIFVLKKTEPRDVSRLEFERIIGALCSQYWVHSRGTGVSNRRLRPRRWRFAPRTRLCKVLIHLDIDTPKVWITRTLMWCCHRCCRRC